MKNKFEIVELNLELNLEDEINERMKTLKSDIIIDTQHFVKREQKRANLKQQSSKGARNKKLIKEQMDKTIGFLEQAYEAGRDDDERWVEGVKLMEVSGMGSTSKDLSKLSLHLKKALAKSDTWIFMKKRKARKTYYRLEKFD